VGENFDIQNVLRTLDEFGSTFKAAGENPRPAELAGVGDGLGTQPGLAHLLSETDRLYLQRGLMQLNNQELVGLFARQLNAGAGKGVPIAQAWSYQTMEAMGQDPIISKALDTSGGAALQRQDLEPILYPIFVRAFPAFDRLRKIPSNGVVHTWNQITDYGDAQFMAELGTVTDDTATYVRQTTNIAQLGTRRGVTFKEQLAVPAGGMNWNPGQIEIQQGLTAMAHKLQKTIFQGQASNSGGTASNELGLYDPNGFTGLRSILNTADAVNSQPYLTSNPDQMVSAIGEAVIPITDNIGIPPTIIFARATEVQKFADQERTLQRFVDRTEVVPGVMVPSVATSVGILPILSVPGDSIGTYTATSTFDGNTVADTYVINEQTIALPYLGSPGPSIIEIPPGVSGQLTRLYIVWALMGLAVEVLPANNKIRNDLGTS
jgi:hypothetical protein